MAMEPDDFIPKGLYPVSGAAALKFAADWCIAGRLPLLMMLPFFIQHYENSRKGLFFLRRRGGPVLINASLSIRPMVIDSKGKEIRPLRGLDQRINKSVDKIREALSSGLMNSFVKNHDGRFTPVPHFFWNTREAEDVLWEDTVARVSTSTSGVAEGRIVVKKSEVVAFCSDGHEGLNTLHMQPEKGTGSQSRIGVSLSPELEYMPAYLEFMLRCAKDMGLTPDERRPKEEIKHWLESNWPGNLPPPSGQKLGYMATLLRDPSHERGGLLKEPRSRVKK
jgi:hypothetical protein